MPKLAELLKSGSISATDATLTGSLTPAQAHSFINVVKDSSAFLQKITTYKMGRLKTELDAIDVARGVLVRVPSGTLPTEAQREKIKMVGCALDANAVQLFAQILQDTLENNKDNPKFESETLTKFATAFGNDLAYLGFAGTSDAYADTFATLHKGWIQLAKDDDDTQKIEYESTDSVTDRLTALVQAIPSDVFSDAVIIIGTADWQRYNYELSQNAAAQILIDGNAKRILGVPLEVQPLMPAGTYLATPLKNLVLGTVLDIRRNRTYDVEARSLKYIFEVYCDYQIIIKKWVTLMTETSGGVQ
ncbi:MAG: P2 family phage major capsid protein [Helicobacteraceae bacterium]|jgi:hypothetical protein|nr:P2 family phage major capsid protein [Helicobacteraceae bacterium]